MMAETSLEDKAIAEGAPRIKSLGEAISQAYKKAIEGTRLTKLINIDLFWNMLYQYVLIVATP